VSKICTAKWWTNKKPKGDNSDAWKCVNVVGSSSVTNDNVTAPTENDFKANIEIKTL